MGLFGKKDTEEIAAAITDFFSAEDLSQIKAIIGPKVADKAYKLEFRGFAADLLNAAENADQPLGKKEVKSLLYAVGCMTKMEPSLDSILKSAIEKMRAFR